MTQITETTETQSAEAQATEAQPLATTYPLNITLPSGKVATILRRMKGRDQLKCTRMSNGRTEEVPFWALVDLVEVDGKKLVFEDWLDMDLEDLLPIQEVVFAGKKPDSPADKT